MPCDASGGAGADRGAGVLLSAVLTAVMAAGASAAGAGPRIVYTKTFPGSAPDYVNIVVERDGRTSYREAADDEDPLRFQLSASDTEALFALADKLDRFRRPLESGLKVARMGTKTLRYEGSGEAHETSFNYSTDPEAQTLADGFEKIIETERDFIELDRAVHFDTLGVNDALLRVETTWDHRRLVSPAQFYPLLERIFKNESYLHMARERAAKLEDEFKNPPPMKEGAKQTP